VPATPLDDEFAGTLFDKAILAEKSETVTVLTEALEDGLRRTNNLSVIATLEAIGSSDIFLLLSAMIYSEKIKI
jgi:hypothetical protein